MRRILTNWCSIQFQFLLHLLDYLTLKTISLTGIQVLLLPKDSLDQTNDYWDTMLAMKKINSSDISQVVRKTTWASGITYDMWRNDITRTNPSQPSGSFDIYSANYYVMNSDFRVYICLYNNAP